MTNRIIKILPIAILSIAWLCTYSKGIFTAINIWTISEIFNHCYLVIPGALFLIYQKRSQLNQQVFTVNYWLIIPLTGTLILYTFGYVGDIRLFMHIATFVSLPLLIWMVIGNAAATIIAFPLYFMLFAIPIGDQLIPFLQELTTDLAVPLLEMTGVPIYRNGLYLDIPEGRFLVAEACSGISFLIASIVFGNVYAYISFRQLPKQLLFVAISIIVPIIANGLRVYGIILTAHLTDMEYAAGADHLIYGGVFYGIILFLLIGIGERFRDKDISLNLSVQAMTSNSSSDISKYWFVAGVVVILFVMQLSWLRMIESNSNLIQPSNLIKAQLLFSHYQKKKSVEWQPSFPQASETQQGAISLNKDVTIDFFVAAYASGSGELISSINKLYNAKHWTLTNTRAFDINHFNQQAQLTFLVSPSGERRVIVHWYQISDKFFVSKIKAKLFQTVNLLMGKTSNNALVAFSLQVPNYAIKPEEELIKFIEENADKLDKIVQSK